MNTRALVMLLLVMGLALQGCQTAFQVDSSQPVHLPFMKNYLDEFMPVPDGMVSGKSGSMDLRYYSYKTANYKEWRLKGIMLSFYSKNGRCWSLFEEYYVAE